VSVKGDECAPVHGSTNVSVFAIALRGSEVLLLRRARTGWKDGFYRLPAGGHDGGETSRTPENGTLTPTLENAVVAAACSGDATLCPLPDAAVASAQSVNAGAAVEIGEFF
jgi:8-oxo-dGTP pyrophosphatase MutT (NUDIX family)